MNRRRGSERGSLRDGKVVVVVNTHSTSYVYVNVKEKSEHDYFYAYKKWLQTLDMYPLEPTSGPPTLTQNVTDILSDHSIPKYSRV